MTLLSAVIFLPAAGAVLLFLWKKQDVRRIRLTALGVSLATLVVAVLCGVRYAEEVRSRSDYGGFYLECTIPWVGNPDEPASEFGALEISYHIGVDGISIWLVLLTALLTPLAIAASFSGISQRVREYYICMLILQTGMTGVFCALDLLLFYVFFEFTLIPLYLIIGIWGGPERRRAASKFFIYTMAGSVLTFAGVLFIGYYVFARSGGDVLTFDLPKLYALAGDIPLEVQWWLFLALFAGFAIKVPLFPFHTWLPLAHTEAPTAGSVLLAAVLLKLGTYGFLRISLPLLSEASFALAPLMAVIAVVGIIYGALVAWVQTDIKKLVAYSSVSHLGFCVLGLFSLKIAGVSGSVLYMLNHGLSTGALFLLVGMIYERYHTRRIDQLGGLAGQMPWLAFFLVFFSLSSIGLPGLNGFVGEYLVLLGTVLSDTTYDQHAVGPLNFSYAIPAASGIVLSALYMLWMCQRVLFGPAVAKEPGPGRSQKSPGDLNRREIGILLPIAVCCVWLGVYPRSVQRSLEPTISANVMSRFLPDSSRAAREAAPAEHCKSEQAS